MARKPIYAAGGVVVRGRARRRVAVVQRSKDERWVLPRGKLKRNENPLTGARREVVEETGHRVRIFEFLGAITYRTRGRPKVVQFWRMEAYERPSRDVMNDIITVEWLTLGQAVQRLSYPLEKLFLQHAGPHVLKQGKTRQRRVRRKIKVRQVKRGRRAMTHQVARARKPRTRAGKTRDRASRLRRRRGSSSTRTADAARRAA